MKLFKLCGLRYPLTKTKHNLRNNLQATYNSPDRFQLYFDQSIENFTSFGKRVIIMGDFNIDLLKCEASSYSHDFLSSLQSCFLIPFIDKPTRVRSSFATLMDNIFVNTPYKIEACGNIISDGSDHFSQFCIKRKHVSVVCK